MKIETSQNRERDREPSGLRLKIYAAAVLLIIGLLMGRLVQMQLLGQDQYTEEAYGNAVRQKISEPARGLIYDRNGALLVDNQPTYTVLVTPRYFNEAELPLLVRLLGVDDSLARVRYDRLVQRSRYQSGVLFDRIPFEAFARVQEQSWRFTGLNFEIGQRRRYHTDANAAHVLGYLREITDRQLDLMRQQGYDLGMIVGQTGVEREYETVLRGRPGREFVLVNTHGMEVSRFRGGEDDIPPQSGFELHLTLDSRVQALAESLMYRKRGGVVALDPRTGGIIAMVSAPDYDPEGWTGRMSQEFVDHVMRNPLQPLFNRATQMSQPPGSTWKVWMSLWALEEGMINENTRLTCGGGYSLGGRVFRCLGVHGSISVRDAIRVSCNTFYYRLMNDTINGRRMDLTTWSQWARRFGFGTLAPMDYPDQATGLIPDSSYFNRVFPAGWGPGYTINLGIGQGNMGVTPLQLARGTAAIANGGTLVDPHFVSHLINPDTGERIEPAHRGRPTGASERNLRIVQEGMDMVVEAGTARRVSLADRGIAIAAKTGTAQNPHGENHSVFIAYAPADDPQIAVGVIIENAGYGGTVAAPIASLMIEQFLLGDVARPEMVERLRALRSEGQ
jgi:penicillin-binding protein 2